MDQMMTAESKYLTLWGEDDDLAVTPLSLKMVEES